METPRSYSPLQRLLHWVIAAAVIVMIPVGIYMVRRGQWSNFDALTNTLYSWHKLIGFCVLWLVVLRIIVRLVRGAPPPEPLHPLQQFAASATHFGLYVLILLVPILGWTGVSAYGARGTPLGFNLPEILAQNQALGETILVYHGWAAILLGLLALMHIGAALMHRFILKDGVFARMWPSAGGRR
ncbi:MAG: cytochrome b [Hyphomicrobiaceae bacterium]